MVTIVYPSCAWLVLDITSQPFCADTCMEAKRKALEGIVSKPAPAQQAPQPTEEEKPAKPTVQPVQ